MQQKVAYKYIKINIKSIIHDEKSSKKILSISSIHSYSSPRLLSEGFEDIKRSETSTNCVSIFSATDILSTLCVAYGSRPFSPPPATFFLRMWLLARSKTLPSLCRASSLLRALQKGTALASFLPLFIMSWQNLLVELLLMAAGGELADLWTLSMNVRIYVVESAPNLAESRDLMSLMILVVWKRQL